MEVSKLVYTVYSLFAGLTTHLHRGHNPFTKTMDIPVGFVWDAQNDIFLFCAGVDILGSMYVIYLQLVDFHGKPICKYTIHGWYGP